MNYIQQAYKGDIGFWKYLIIPVIFIGIVILNMITIDMFDIDQAEIIRNDIAEKGENRVLIESLATFVVFLAALLLWVKYVHRQSITSLTTSRKKIDWKRVFFAFSVWGFMTVVFVIYGYYTDPASLQWNFEPNKFLGLLVIGILMIPLQTSFEEYLFRGYLLQGIGAKFKSRLIPLIITSVIFGLLHIANPEVGKLGNIVMIYYIGTGFFLGMITLLDEGLELALGFHAANNLIGALLITADWTAFQTNSIFKDLSEPDVYFDIIIPVVVFYPLLLLFFAKKYNWSNWKEKLTGSIEKPVNNQENQIEGLA
ncbi:CAAX protease family protein [Tenacibaculum sp. SZ-18]|uniref:CPBP family intramembrane glutamic endopeptidase n=1 Tax=Tenacibaculum sp. SZ-18 TaxID=754423 RepID=UPI000C2D02F0|nr:CPBP family intramembrane glutamic endopeptidase [Tenacibaculum sp. SZ-18]AUC15512.1 CAAX protease family protein [Tenacibaculum sp. SZ-18]